MSSALKQAQDRATRALAEFEKRHEPDARPRFMWMTSKPYHEEPLELMFGDLRELLEASKCDAEPMAATLGLFDNTDRLRDEFAMHALQGILSNEGAAALKHASGVELVASDCQRAYAYADAMMKARAAA